MSLSARGVSVRFRNNKGIWDVSVRFGVGLHLLAGPNGSGKTTLLRIMVGDLRPSDGGVLVADQVSTPSQLRAQVGYLPQGDDLPPMLTARETLDYAAWLSGADRKTRTARVADVLELANLTDAAGTPARKLSGGTRRRLQVGCALITGPAVLVCDEPANGLDVDERRRLTAHLARVAQSRPVIVSSHHGGEWIGAARTALVLRDGRAVYSGGIDDFLAGPGGQHHTTLAFDDAYAQWGERHEHAQARSRDQG
ncbi:ABC transporter ATP-binding protein [Flexivirga oryzae]|uniref:ABC transporter ATP-binding protein n=1 Tax=Flexivirga oryzae TaxID=1794944 RepID=UPI0024843305|nr:ATP-binding cassette domain-containing protein [Flexivirga oryzae]